MDISTTGTPLGGGDDNSYGLTVPANCANAAFPAGVVNVCTNGHMGYGGADTQYGNNPLPSTFAYTNNVACVYWDDLITTTTHGGNLYAKVIGNTLIVQWNNMDRYSSSPGAATFQIQIFGNNSGPGGAAAQYIYRNMDTGDGSGNGASATIGYQVGTGNAVQYSFNNAGSVSSGSVITLLANVPTGGGAAPRAVPAPS